MEPGLSSRPLRNRRSSVLLRPSFGLFAQDPAYRNRNNRLLLVLHFAEVKEAVAQGAAENLLGGVEIIVELRRQKHIAAGAGPFLGEDDGNAVAALDQHLITLGQRRRDLSEELFPLRFTGAGIRFDFVDLRLDQGTALRGAGS